MTREKRDQPQDDRIENEAAEDFTGDERRASNVNSDSNELARGEQSDASDEQSPGAGNIGDSAADETADRPPIDEAASAAASAGVDSPVPDSVAEVVARLPPPEPLPAGLVSNSLIASASEPASISFGELASQASPAGAESVLANVGENVPGPSPEDLVQQAFSASDARGPSVPPAAQDDLRRDSPGSPPVHQLPFVMEVGHGERRVQKRLEIEIVVTVTNQARIAAITSNETMGMFSDLAGSSVYKVAEDLRTFRESYRNVWGRRF